MSVTLEVALKDGKTAIKASIQGAIDDALGEYDKLTARFNGAPSPAPATTKSKKADASQESQGAENTQDATASLDTASGGDSNNVVEISKKPAVSAAENKRQFSQRLIALNEEAVLKANRLAFCIPQFNGKTALEIAQILNYKKPLASMEADELNELIRLINLTLHQYGENNPGVRAYLYVVEAIDKLKTGTAEEWAKAKSGYLDASPTVWPVLAQPGNAPLFEAAKQYLAERQAVLQAANALGAESA